MRRTQIPREFVWFAGLLCCLTSVGIAPGQTPPLVLDLNNVIEADDLSAVDRLIQSGVSVNGKDLDGRTPITVAAVLGKHRIVQRLIRAGADLKARGASGMTPLAAAASGGDLRTVRVMLDASGELDATGALVVAVSQGRLDVARILLEAGVDPGRAPGHSLALAVASESGFVELINLLLDYGANVSGVYNRGSTVVRSSPAIMAVFKGRHEALRVLLARGADPEIGDPATEVTPLAAAVQGGWTDCVRTLVAYGADVNRRDSEGRTVLHLAAQGPHPSMITLLASLEADVDAQADDGRTPLIAATAAGRSDNVSLLLEGGLIRKSVTRRARPR